MRVSDFMKLERLEPHQELAARLGGDVASDRVDGRLWVGEVERAFFGRFTLLRGASEEAVEGGQDDQLASEGEHE